MSIGTVKGVEIGSGFGVAKMKGSESNDPIVSGTANTLSNHAGGFVGEVFLMGKTLWSESRLKPASSIGKKSNRLLIGAENLLSSKSVVVTIHVFCPRLVPVAEAMTALVIVDYWLMNKLSRG